MMDGQGIAHPRQLGIAAHLGLILDIPTIGVAKSRLCGTFAEPAKEAGNFTELTDKGESIGWCCGLRIMSIRCLCLSGIKSVSKNQFTG